MAKITLNGIDALTESGGTVTVAAGTNLVLGTGAVPTSAIADDAVTGAKIENNPTIAGNLTVAGALTVNGTTTAIDTVNLEVKDKNIDLAKTSSPSDANADGGGITLKGTTDKTILWENDTDSWNFNQNIETSTTTKVKQKGAFMQSSTHQALTLGS